jgi:phospholipid/cholesterol/gamma-HCH transport system substrate-binding protein
MVTNLNEQVREVKPIMENLKIATDKIATDPRILGVKGALDRRPLNTGVKDSFHLFQPNSSSGRR